MPVYLFQHSRICSSESSFIILTLFAFVNQIFRAAEIFADTFTLAKQIAFWYNVKSMLQEGGRFSLPRFFVPPGSVQGGFLTLSGENAAHARVLRLKTGDSVAVCDGSGTDYTCTVSDVAPGCVSLVVNASGASQSEPAVRCSVFMAFSKADKFEHVIQKATELGAVKIVAFPSARCVSRPDKVSLGKKLERWQKIAASAAGQCGRGVIPQVLAADSYEQALSWAAQSALVLFPYENEKALSLRAALSGNDAPSVSIVTGPEGGFTPEEVALAQEKGLRICTLGPRILRCETAPLCALTCVLFANGALD